MQKEGAQDGRAVGPKVKEITEGDEDDWMEVDSGSGLKRPSGERGGDTSAGRGDSLRRRGAEGGQE